jgi:hypothetical protein
MNYLERIAVVGLTALLTVSGGCGGGGSDGGSVVPRQQTFGGLWVGTLSIDGSPGSQELIGISVDDGRFQFLSVDTLGQFAGTARLSGGSVSGSGKGFAPPGTTWRDGTTVTNVTFSGVLDERRTFEGSWSTSTGESGSFDLAYDPDYEKDSSLSLVAGVWTVYDDNLNPFATFTVDADGRFSGSNQAGCNSMGRISIIDSRFAVYDFESVVAGCPIAGDYAGLALLADLDNPNDAILALVNNDERALLLALER